MESKVSNSNKREQAIKEPSEFSTNLETKMARRSTCFEKGTSENTGFKRTNNGRTSRKKTGSEIVLAQNTISCHTYSANVIFLSLQLILTASVSFRGSEQVLTLVNHAFGNPLERIPSWSSVRGWFLRIGYYKLMCPKEIADDWCWILDHTIQLGKTKCLLILGIRLSELPANKQALRHQDLVPIALIPVETSTGEIVHLQLKEACLKTGIPRVIISDYGSDLKAGIEKFCQENPSCIPLYDIKHKTACLLKADMEKDEQWLAFRKQAAQTRNQLQQTALSHLKAPNQRSKARYMNINILLKWAKNTLNVIENKDDFSEAERQQLPKLEWLKSYKDPLEGWDESLQVMMLTEQWVRKEGIGEGAYSNLTQYLAKKQPVLKHERAIQLKEKVTDFVHLQENLAQGEKRLPASSEVIESVFGKQKYIERDYVKEGFTSLIIGIGALVGTMTVETVKEAMIATPVKMVTDWCKNTLGETLQSKKIEAYSNKEKGTKVGSSLLIDT